MKTKIFFLFILCSSMITGFSQFPTNGLVAWYPFSGNANDVSGNGYNCTVYGATLTTDRFGKPSSAYSFDGINDNISRNSLLNSCDYSTISFWVYSSLDCQAIAPMVADGDGGMSYNGYGVVQNCHATGTVQCPGCGNFLNVMLFGGWWNATNSTATVPLMTWTYLTLTKQHNNWSLYVNAVLVGTGIATPIMPNGSFFIGGNPSGTHCYK
ncbi:MAG: LamG-like jellyroll fold domain-containing protein, partial [Bacteroidota bacterium]